MIRRNKKENGFGLLEVVIGVAIISVSIFSLTAVSSLALRIAEENTKEIQAVFLAEEGLEALRVLRDSSWLGNIATLNSSTDYFLNFSEGKWQVASSNIYIDGIFERKFSLQNINRDSNDDIVASGGSNDPNTKKFTVSVSWLSRKGTTTRSISTYSTNFFSN